MLASLLPFQQALLSYRTLKLNAHHVSSDMLISQAESSAQGSSPK